MNILKAINYEDLSSKAGTIVSAQVLKKPDSVLGFATGSTPLGLYDKLVKAYETGLVDFSHINSFNLDEYIGLSKENEQSYNYFMHKNLFNKINIPAENVNIPDGLSEDLGVEVNNYERKIEGAGGIDLQILGIGHNGHIGFNEPDKFFTRRTGVVQLTESTIAANSRFFNHKDDVPKYAISMGIETIMNTRSILILISGKDKSEIMNKMINSPITPEVPASVLQLHKDVTLIYCD
ncbi:MAG: glucosamine-6-phosphate deaminase [Clostridiales bacterium]|jgi:glucosamine-6-phosphate deaminase|nr:glucosamine-6-phosphate deaminase [Clostridiales bacterium]